jgi:uroporphyrinogen-III synthase
VTRVGVTTSADRSERVADAYAARGLTPVILPCIRVESGSHAVIDGLRAASAGADLILVTSARAIEVVWPSESMPPTPVAAVGEATARAALEAGGTVSLTGLVGAYDLADRIGRGPGTIVFPHAAGTDPGVSAVLAENGWDVIEAVAYRAEPIAPDDDPVDAVAFASPTAVAGWCSARTLDRLVVGAIGPTTAAALSGRGRPPDVIAQRPGHTSLATALAGLLHGKITT